MNAYKLSAIDSSFTALAALNVNEHVEKKGAQSYLSWPWALFQLYRHDPNATFEYGAPLMYGDTMMVVCTVKAFGKARTMHLPVMDNRNRAIPNPDSFAVNTAMMRCLVKAIALHGLGLYIYAGEDLPAVDRAASDGPQNERLLRALQALRDAALNGMKALEVHWKGLPEPDRTALRADLASLKEAARSADTARAIISDETGDQHVAR